MIANLKRQETLARHYRRNLHRPAGRRSASKRRGDCIAIERYNLAGAAVEFTPGAEPVNEFSLVTGATSTARPEEMTS